MEQFEAIADRQPVFAGDLISKVMTRALVEAGLVMRNAQGDYILSANGHDLMELWDRVKT